MQIYFDLFISLFNSCLAFTDVYFLLCCCCFVALFSSAIRYLFKGSY